MLAHSTSPSSRSPLPTVKPFPSLALLILASFILMTPPTVAATSSAAANKLAVQTAFDAWRAGAGGPFALLAPNSTWTITGQSLVAKTYHSKDEFMDIVIKPFNARLTSPLVPSVRSLRSDGDTVVIHFDGEALASDGQRYRNTYAWFMPFHEGQIVEVTAFFDSIAFDTFWRRVGPKTTP